MEQSVKVSELVELACFMHMYKSETEKYFGDGILSPAEYFDLMVKKHHSQYGGSYLYHNDMVQRVLKHNRLIKRDKYEEMPQFN